MAQKEIHIAVSPLEFQMTCIAVSVLSEILHGRLALKESPVYLEDALKAIIDQVGGSCATFHNYMDKLALIQNIADVDISSFTFGKH